jgi:MarR family 2-MHQ and catechol resistance regulon transcriptional repressor
MGERFLKSVRLLAECMQGFERFTAESVRECGLTPPQFDIIATLGNTPGMCCKDLGEKTLITKGTLTGVIDRLELKGLVARERSGNDKRSFFVRLTPAGEAMFDDVFPKVIAQAKTMFSTYGENDLAGVEATLASLKQNIATASAQRAAMTKKQEKDSV